MTEANRRPARGAEYAPTVKRIALLPLLLLIVSGCGGDGEDNSSGSKESAGDFVVQVNEWLLDKQADPAWDSLHPTQRKLFRDQSTFARCMTSQFGSQYAAGSQFRAAAERSQPWKIPGTADAVPSKEVTIQVIQDGSVVDTFTQHAFRSDSHWTWIVSPQAVKALRADAC